ncbi:MAG: hypothetical protein QCI82_06565 [Candidatus Thermoplasmatota archaeon]|nr:hypothetical protein [Candidatus Thermoplasmatota archaeon]
MNDRLLLILITALTLAVSGSILASSVVPPSRTANANCSSCHSSYYLSVEITDLKVADSILNGDTEDVTMTVTARSSGTSSYYAFSMTARLVSVNSKIQVPAQQSDTGQRPSGTSAPYTWTKTYTFTVKGISTGSDTLRGEAVMDPNHRSPAVTDTLSRAVDVLSSNSPPQLSNGEVNPSQGDDLTSYRYSVTYRDPDGTVPLFVNVIIDGTDVKPMSKVQGGDIVSGAEYYLDGAILSPGSHTFHFAASDGEAAARLPASGSLTGPEVLVSNRPPALRDGTVSPPGGRPNDSFRFTVIYEDPDDDPPSGGVRFHVDGVMHPEPMELDTEAHLSLKDGSFVNGESFFILIELDEGEHIFSFRASDGVSEVSLGPLNGPLVSEEAQMSASILMPEDGSVFSAEDEIAFSCEAISNVDISDANYLWTSNISGSLSDKAAFNASLPVGEHLITVEIYSVANDISASAYAAVIVKETVSPYLEILSREPVGDPVIDEMETIVFGVDVLSFGGAEYSIVWLVNGVEMKSGEYNFSFKTGYDTSGEYMIEAVFMMDGVEWTRTSWRLTVIDVPAPILITDEWPPEMEYGLGENFVITLPCRDPLDRELRAEWRIDGIPLTNRELEITLWAGERPFCTLGRHSVTAVVLNPDGVSMSFELDYLITGNLPPEEEIPRPPPKEDSIGGLGDPSENWLGYSIVIIFSMLIMLKAAAAFAALVPKRSESRDAEVME